MKENSRKPAPKSKPSNSFFQKQNERVFFSKENQNPFFNISKVQPKLSIGQPNDKYEQEADAMAEQVVQNKNISPTAPRSIQKISEGQSGSTPTQQSSSSTESTLRQSQGKGNALPKNTQSEMETAFGQDFSNVKIHTGSEAQSMSQDLGALAFTHGSDIYFNSGQFNPNSNSGKKLLAHELTHTIQQGQNGKNNLVQRQIGIQEIFPYAETTYQITINNQTFQYNESNTFIFCARILSNLFDQLDNRVSSVLDYHDRVRLGRTQIVERGVNGAVREGERNSAREAWNLTAATISEWYGDAEFDMNTFGQASTIWDQAAAALRSRNFVLAVSKFNAFETAYNQGVRRWNTFVEHASGGAQDVADILQTTSQISLLVVATLATGGIATAIEGSAAVGAIAATTGLSTEAATVVTAGAIAQGTRATVEEGLRETGEFLASGDLEIDWARSGRNILTAAVSGAVTGGMVRWLKGVIASRILTMPVVKNLIQQEFISMGNNVIGNNINSFLSNHGTELMARLSAEIILNPLRGLVDLAHEDLSFSEFLDRYKERLLARGFARTVAQIGMHAATN